MHRHGTRRQNSCDMCGKKLENTNLDAEQHAQMMGNAEMRCGDKRTDKTHAITQPDRMQIARNTHVGMRAKLHDWRTDMHCSLCVTYYSNARACNNNHNIMRICVMRMAYEIKNTQKWQWQVEKPYV